MKRILLDNGQFVPAKKEAKKVNLKKVEKKVGEVKVEKKVGGPKVEVSLTGEETTPELKAKLETLGVAFAKNANKEKCLELLAPHLTESVDDL